MTDSVKPEPVDLEKMNGTSLDIAEQRRRELKQLLPGVFTETTGQDGQPVETIDFERLKAELGTFSDVYEGRRERYGMEWPGKRDCMKLIQEPSRATLKPCREESVDFDTTQNLFIEGDNLEVLKLLQKSYYGKVKMIYIDPPYNTGNEFIYPDNYAESLETYLSYAGLVDDEGKKFSTNTAAEGRFHTKWLNMMFPRLFLARNLLRDDGVIFISIDDNEVENLRRMCDEIFGEESRLACIVWKRRQVPDNRNKKGVSEDHEYVLAYGRNASVFKGKEKDLSKYTNPDNDPRGPWMSDNMTGLATKEQRPNLHYDVIDPETNRAYPPHPGRGWAYEKTRMEKLIAEKKVLWPSKIDGRPRIKRFLADIKDSTTGFSTIQNPGYTTDGTREVSALMEFKAFDFPKPKKLLKALVAQVTDPKYGDIIIDLFAGSCTTADAVIESNFEDSGDRKYLMVQLPERLDEKSEACRRGFSSVADIGKERIRRAVKMLKENADVSQSNLEQVDCGLRVFKLDRSNFRQWKGIAADANGEILTQELDLHVENIGTDFPREDLLYELLIKAGFSPTHPVETIALAGKSVFSVAEGALLVCLEEELTSELIDAVADREPMQFICLDKGFRGNDQLKANAVQTFKSRSQGAETEMVFKVV